MFITASKPWLRSGRAQGTTKTELEPKSNKISSSSSKQKDAGHLSHDELILI